MDEKSLVKISRRRIYSILMFAAFFTGAVTSAVHAQSGALTTGPFVNTDRIDTQLKRGTSTKADVERLLGKPNGKGGTLMPPSQTVPGDVWVYYNAQSGSPRMTPTRPIKVEVDSRHQMVMIFFNGNIFDGYMWFLHSARSGGDER